MGMIYTAECKNCGFRKDFLLGSTWKLSMEYEGDEAYNDVPAIDLRTNEFVSVNYPEFRNDPNYKFYNHPDLHSGPPLEQNTERFSFNQHGNYCPACKTKSLRIFWDLGPMMD
jgi:hypothetical protein